MAVIPRIFHRIWLDDPGPPNHFEQFWTKFSQLHPDYEFKTWSSSKEAVELLTYPELWDKVNPLAGRTDVLRYELVAKFGGVYVDTDVEPLKNWDPLLEFDKPFIGWESEDRLCPTVIGGPPGHPALIDLVNELPSWVEQHADEKDPVIQTGPIFITKAWSKREDVIRLPLGYFYPIGPTERRLIGHTEYPAFSYSVHHWAKGWGKTI